MRPSRMMMMDKQTLRPRDRIRLFATLGFDVANGISPDERYVRIATGLDYKDAAPVFGMRYGDGEEDMSVNLQIQQQ